MHLFNVCFTQRKIGIDEILLSNSHAYNFHVYFMKFPCTFKDDENKILFRIILSNQFS